ncbi:hypothetical protein L6164_024321 [Bauhinia variegata]|uniref:Uncharacterized protein n=1 Tax=Bauhinia variegata TaxID=167791 RepID=A0ACB9LX44_BAUVA|nr:hypothetical protein L6164_024321 [Bauhinia variegata]
MLSPNPVSLLCALLLCLPLAIVFTSTGTTNLKPKATIAGILGGNPRGNFLFVGSGGTHTSREAKNSEEDKFVIPLPEDDEALFRVAAHAKAKPVSPRKIAFVFLTTTPLPFAPFWESYFNGTPKNLFNIYIHADPNFSYDPPFTGVFSDRVIYSKHTERYSPTLISAARRLLAHALIKDSSNYMFVLLSASCIPLHSFRFTYNTLVNSRKSFIEILNNEIGSYDRWAARGPDVMLPEVRLEDFRIGSQFWALTRKHAKLVVADRTLWSKFGLPCVRWDTCYPEENYFPTLLSMWDARGCVPATLTHVDWRDRNDGHPRTYNASEVGPELIESMRRQRPRYGDDGSNGSDWYTSTSGRWNDPFLFARKFSPDALEPLMRIANDVIFRD